MSIMINVINGYSFKTIFSYTSDIIPRENEVIHRDIENTATNHITGTSESFVAYSENYKVRNVVHKLVKDNYTSSYSLAYIDVFVESV